MNKCIMVCDFNTTEQILSKKKLRSRVEMNLKSLSADNEENSKAETKTNSFSRS